MVNGEITEFRKMFSLSTEPGFVRLLSYYRGQEAPGPDARECHLGLFGRLLPPLPLYHHPTAKLYEGRLRAGAPLGSCSLP